MKVKFNDFVQKYGLKNRATANKKIEQVFLSSNLSGRKIYLRDSAFSSDIGIVILHPSKG